MIDIGLVSIDVSHPKVFAQLMQEHQMGMQYKMLYDDGFRKPEERAWLVEKYKMDGQAASIDELAEKTEIGFIQSCNWEKHLEQAMPFLQRGKPVFIDKPIVGTVKDIRKIEQLDRDGAVILGSSSARYAREVQEFLAIPEEERGQIVAMFGTVGVDEFSYTVHIVEIFSELAGCPAIGCQFIANSQRGGLDSRMFRIEYENGIHGVFCTTVGRWQPFVVTIMTTKTSYTFTIDSSKIYIPMLWKVADYMKTGNNTMKDVPTLTNCSAALICGKKSMDEGKGFVRMEDLDENDGFDGYAYEKKYGDAAATLYQG